MKFKFCAFLFTSRFTPARMCSWCSLKSVCKMKTTVDIKSFLGYHSFMQYKLQWNPTRVTLRGFCKSRCKSSKKPRDVNKCHQKYTFQDCCTTAKGTAFRRLLRPSTARFQNSFARHSEHLFFITHHTESWKDTLWTKSICKYETKYCWQNMTSNRWENLMNSRRLPKSKQMYRQWPFLQLFLGNCPLELIMEDTLIEFLRSAKGVLFKLLMADVFS